MRLLIVTGLLASWGTAIWVSAATLPPPPTLLISDEVGVLSSQTIQSVEQVLEAHEKKTGDQILISIFKSLQGEDLVAWTNQIYKHWKIGQKGKDNGALLALYWQDRRARIEVGYGLEGRLTDAKSKQVLSQVLVPALKEGKPDQGIVLSTLQLLTILESPLIQSGEAEQLLRGAGVKPHRSNGGIRLEAWHLDLLIFILFIIVSILTKKGRGIHYSSSGRRGGWGGWGGGSSGGGGGDFGGFSGGGGSSGGGGASDRW